ncbi:hypothetical protein [Amylibacter sp. IMCC11727]|uniref:hypothetical protein n=1 Tax=Amylibacter sp. IMCC11727 TaxID=3039851 RepID=UPI00244DA829|nr:hypothetical protein [Amylibacter sp. IMCC11727]WGI21225.1 hypothetical protein QBD29_14060 [Amylibacter sp. IMCC11727]WGI21227.1 hypothetical protein QBD29_14070 [Amylibacter sp. IMCC11727]WGI21920.1 hypothetical protein QBD29_00420 [Amylibacter sp. IMCC11727]WGI21922.1 hypothetical protein QBD29_00430 [Amylibacter sp. IMCC11727]WGI22397.1 hypothetical protein QBD29_02985 [Amylibacter sp. IMCC11727]
MSNTYKKRFVLEGLHSLTGSWVDLIEFKSTAQEAQAKLSIIETHLILPSLSIEGAIILPAEFSAFRIERIQNKFDDQ